MTHTGPIGLNEVYRYEPATMPKHPDRGRLIRVTGLLYNPATAQISVRTLGDGQCSPTEDIFRRDYTLVSDPAPYPGIGPQ